MSARQKRVYKIQFHNCGKLYELHAREVSQGAMYAFVEVGGIIFGERAKVVVDPSEERMRTEFGKVRRTYIPLHSVVRIDEVESAGANKITDGKVTGGVGAADNVSMFPLGHAPKGK